VPPLPKSASTAIAAAVVAAVAALVPLAGPGAGGSSASASPAATTARPAPSAAPSAVPGPSGSPAASVGLLVLGDSAALHPRGGDSRSYACRAATTLRLHCAVRSRAGAPVAPGTRADGVLVVLSIRDDATTVAAALDALPASLHGTGTVLLAPVVVAQPAAVARNLAGIRAVASARGAGVVDPAALHWVTAATRHTYLAADGVQPTAAGLEHLAERLATALAAAGV